MKKQNKFPQQLPRPVRTFIHILGCIVCLAVIYIAIGSPAFTAEMQLRRLEKSHLIGPSVILGIETVSEGSSEKLMITESESNVILYRYWESAEITSTDLVCRKKTGSLTVLAAGGQDPYLPNHRGITLPVILFDDYPNATRAELDITLTYPYEILDDKYNPIFQKKYTLESARTNSGYFYFTIFHEKDGDERIAFMLQTLSDASSSEGRSFNTIPVTVRLYDKRNNLIHTEQLYILGVKAEAQKT